MIVVYTAVFGNYDRVLVPSALDAGARYVCFTDNVGAIVGPWEIKEVRRTCSPHMANRMCKILAHRWFPNIDWSIYVDGSMKLLWGAQPLIDDVQASYGAHEIYAVEHPHTLDGQPASVYQEAHWVSAKKLAPLAQVDAQVARYRRAGCPDDTGRWQCGLLIRKHTAMTARFNERWWDEVRNYTHRDQISFPFVAWRLGMSIGTIPYERRSKAYTKWVGHTRPRTRYK